MKFNYKPFIKTINTLVYDNFSYVNEMGVKTFVDSITDNNDGTKDISYRFEGGLSRTVTVDKVVLENSEYLTPSILIGVSTAYTMIRKNIDNLNFDIPSDYLLVTEIFEKCFIEKDFYEESIGLNEITQPMADSGVLYDGRFKLDVFHYVFGAIVENPTFTNEEISSLINLGALSLSHAYREYGYPDNYFNVLEIIKNTYDDDTEDDYGEEEY